ncbi:MAG: hypothetical protein HYZ72_06290 [Deltaproteobacteria bacterium]|nr:hypothetical protein [Deltaproteobacteria bacterium]
MVVARRTGQGLGDRRGAGLAAAVAVSGQPSRGARAPQHGLEDGHARDSGEVADDGRELAVPLVAGLLQVLDVLAGIAHVRGPQPQRAAQDARRLVRPKRRCQQPVGGQSLDPWAIAAIGLGACLPLRGVAGIDAQPLEAFRFPPLLQGNPGDAGRFPRDGGDTAVPQPGDESRAAVGVRRELPDGVGAVAGRPDAHPVRCGRDVDAGGMAMADGPRRGGCGRWMGDGLRRVGLPTRCGLGVCLPAGFRLGRGRGELPPRWSGLRGVGVGVAGRVCSTMAVGHDTLPNAQGARPGRGHQAGPPVGNRNGPPSRKRSAGERPGWSSLPHGKRGTARDRWRTPAVTTDEAATRPSSEEPTGRRRRA